MLPLVCVSVRFKWLLSGHQNSRFGNSIIGRVRRARNSEEKMDRERRNGGEVVDGEEGESLKAILLPHGRMAA